MYTLVLAAPFGAAIFAIGFLVARHFSTPEQRARETATVWHYGFRGLVGGGAIIEGCVSDVGFSPRFPIRAGQYIIAVLLLDCLVNLSFAPILGFVAYLI